VSRERIDDPTRETPRRIPDPTRPGPRVRPHRETTIPDPTKPDKRTPRQTYARTPGREQRDS